MNSRYCLLTSKGSRHCLLTLKEETRHKRSKTAEKGKGHYSRQGSPVCSSLVYPQLNDPVVESQEAIKSGIVVATWMMTGLSANDRLLT